MSLDVSDWIDTQPAKALELGWLNLVRTCGMTVNYIAGCYLINKPIFHPWTGGVMWVDWSTANIQESPLVIEKYYRDLQKPFVWWSDIRHEPPGFANQAKWMGLVPVEKMVGLSFDMAGYKALKPMEKFDIFMVQDSKEKEDFIHLYEKSFDYSEEFKKEAVQLFKGYEFQDRVHHQVGYFRGHPVCMGTIHALTDHAMISNLATDPKHRGKGYGTRMLEDLLGSAYYFEMRRVFTIVRESEASFFLNYGFQKIVDFNVYATQEVINRWPKKETP